SFGILEVPSTFSLLSLNSVIGGNFSNQARIAARPLTAGSLGGLTTASSRNRDAQVAKSLVRAAFTAVCVTSSIFLMSASDRLFAVCPSEGSDIRTNPMPAAITASDRTFKPHLCSINFIIWRELCQVIRHLGSGMIRAHH